MNEKDNYCISCKWKHKHKMNIKATYEYNCILKYKKIDDPLIDTCREHEKINTY